MDYSLSNDDIIKYLGGKCNLIDYSKLKYIDNINDIIKPYDCCVILYLEGPNYGHWVCLTLNGNKLEYFDSYGGMPDDILEYYPRKVRFALNEDFPYLSKLMVDSPYELHYNQYKLQKEKEGINTCGRWCLARIINKHIPLDDFVKFFLDSSNPDLKVTKLISNI